MVRLLVNFFSPSAKLIQKTRVGSKVYKKYDAPQTPYQRVLNYPAIDSKIKEKLQEQFRTLDPVALKRRLILNGPQESEAESQSREAEYLPGGSHGLRSRIGRTPQRGPDGL